MSDYTPGDISNPEEAPSDLNLEEGAAVIKFPEPQTSKHLPVNENLFIQGFFRGMTNQELGDAYCGGGQGAKFRAKRYVDKLRRQGVLPLNYRPKPQRIEPEGKAFIPEHEEGFEEVSFATQLVGQKTAFQRKFHLEKNRTQILLEYLKDRLTPLEPIPVPEIKLSQGRPERVFSLSLSDLHVGQLVTLEDSAGIEEYNIEVFHKRMDVLINKLAAIAERTRLWANLNTIEFNLLGDNIEGELIFPSQSFYTEAAFLDQIKHCRQGLGKLFRYATSAFNKVRVRCVQGNHGRPGSKGFNHHRTNFDTLLYEFLAVMFEDQPNLEFYISKTQDMFYVIPEIPDFNILLIHGNGLSKNKLDTVKHQYAALYNKPVNYIFTGHFHTVITEEIANGGIGINGSWVGGNNYSISTLRAANLPKQALYVFDPEIGLDTQHNIYLDNARAARVELSSELIYTPSYRPMLTESLAEEQPLAA
jgi:hypothetical protein